LKIHNGIIINDFGFDLFIYYGDEKKRFVRISPNESLSLSILVNSHLVEISKFTCWYQNFKTNEFQFIHFSDLKIKYSYLEA
jgi:hypothetical protein